MILLDWGLFGAPVWIHIRCGCGLGLLTGGLEWILVDLTPGAPDLYPIRTATEEEQSTEESMRNVKPISNSLGSTTDSPSNK